MPINFLNFKKTNLPSSYTNIIHTAATAIAKPTSNSLIAPAQFIYMTDKSSISVVLLPVKDTKNVSDK